VYCYRTASKTTVAIAKMPKMARHTVEVSSRYILQPPLFSADKMIGVITDPSWQGHGRALSGSLCSSRSPSQPPGHLLPASRRPHRSKSLSGLTICRPHADQIDHGTWKMPVNPNPSTRPRVSFFVILARQTNFADVYYACSPDLTLKHVHTTLYSFASPLSLW
jgi:hypothetical protein